jgi:hypothetical protein
MPWWLFYPATYLGYMLLCGPLLGHYPYPFLDPGLLGYGQLALNSAALLVVLIVVGAVFVLLKRGHRVTT